MREGGADPNEPQQPADGPGAPEPNLVQRTSDALGDLGEALGDLGEPLVDGASAVAGRLLDATRRLRPREGASARARRLRRLNRAPLPNLFELYPQARTAGRRDLGLLTIPVAAVRGTAVEGPAQRGSDFLPLQRLRTRNWQSRWQRIRAAQESLAVLPPIEVVQAADGYWVVDGHNRVAAALYGGQTDIDADVTHVHLPGSDDEAGVVPGDLESVMDELRQVRAAGTGRLTPGSVVPERRRGSGRKQAQRVTGEPERPDGAEPAGEAEPRDEPPDEP